MSVIGFYPPPESSFFLRSSFVIRLFTALFFSLFISLPGVSQNIVVSDFRLLETDMTANLEGTTVLDQNGEKCALIKVETTQTGFSFDVGALGVSKTEQKIGEIWVYVPERTSRITIFHPQFGVLRNHDLGQSLRKARTYLLKLTTGTVETIVHQEVTNQYLVFQVTPSDAVVEVNEEMWPVSDGTALKFVPFGTYNYRIQARNYHTEAGRIKVSDPANKSVVTITLRPAFGWIEVPGMDDLAGAYVYIDNQLQGQAPVKSGQLSSGPHNIKIVKSLYKSVEQTVTVTDNETLSFVPVLSADFSTVTLTTDAAAEIWVNGERKGTGSWTGPLQSGEYLFETRREGHRSSFSTRTITKAQNQSISLPAPVPVYGVLNIATTPALSDVILDGTPVGQTPLLLSQVLVGTHKVTVRKEHYGDYQTTVSVIEGQTSVVEGALSSLAAVTLSCNAPSARIWVDGTSLGSVAAVRQLGYGAHQVQLRAEGFLDFTDNITVTDSNRTFQFTMTEEKGDTKQTFTVRGVSFTMIPVAGGTFRMGATPEQNKPDRDEKPVHDVTLSSYYIGETEVTQALWEAVMGENPSKFKGSDLPVERVSWKDCQKFIEELNSLTGQKFRLPTEAEWEYAARGGRKSKGYQYSGSDNIGTVAWYYKNSSGETHPVATKQPNELGLYDMSGNVWEWCQDRKKSYSSIPQTNPKGSDSGSSRVERGGSWYNFAGYCRVALRNWDTPGYRYSYLGLRLAL